MGVFNHEVIAGWLLSVLAFVLVTGVFLIFFIIHWRRHNALSASPHVVSGKDQPRPPALNCKHLALKRPGCWLAIKNRNLVAVQSALALHNSKPCSWAEGILGDTDEKLFISPPVSGWILVIGSALPDPNEDVDACYRFLMDLSRKLGHVQFFSANGVLNHHAWAQAESGHVVRAYAWAGKTLWSQGKTTSAEIELNMKCYDYTEAPEPQPFGFRDPTSTNSDKVHLLAARWSLDPEDIDERFIDQEWGIVGEPSRYF